MLTRWLTVVAFLAGSVSPGSPGSGRGSVTFRSTCRVKGHPEEELILHCGDGRREGVVQFWHTPFGDLQSSAPQSDLDPVVFTQRDGSLVIPNSSIHHAGLYYCVLRHAGGSTLWPYELQVGPGGQEAERGDGCAARSFSRNAGSAGGIRDAEVSDGIFAGAVAASVLLTFVVGFSAGALSRTPVLRCLQAVRRRKRQPDMPDGSQVTAMTPLPTNDNQVFGTRATRRDSPAFRTARTPALLTTPSPPAKPKRSFRDKEKEEAEGTAYLEGCDYNQVEEETRRRAEGEVEEEEATKVSFCLQEDERSQSETEEDKSSLEREEEDGEATGERVERKAENQEAAEEERDGEDRGQKADESEEQESTSEDEGSVKNEDETRKGETGGEEPTPGSSRRRSRVIRLYQYDEDGQRYGHLPDPAPVAPEPAPRLKQRSLSLTRLNAIMAAASAGPMERVEPVGQQGEEERPRFQMQI